MVDPIPRGTFDIPRGVFDILPYDKDKWKESHLWQFVEQQAHLIAGLFGYREIRTPMFETADLFLHNIGESSDIVSKEMYCFQDKAGRNLALRPEGTAPVVRAFIEKNLYHNSSIRKFFYLFPLFRYERQQAGRYRQHHQFGTEIFGPSSPFQDAEGIQCLWEFYSRLGLKGLSLRLNSIGNAESRNLFRQALVAYLQPLTKSLSSDSQARLKNNPLRILDSKDPRDQEVLKQAPLLSDFLTPQIKAHFQQVCELLSSQDIPFETDCQLVRGLDYYNLTVFEISAEALGQHKSLGGGGRYDGLIEKMGGPPLCAFGFGTGLERVIQTLLAQQAPVPLPPRPLLYVSPLGEQAQRFCINLATKLRSANISLETDWTEEKLANKIRRAQKLGAHLFTVIGTKELETNRVALKKLSSGTEQVVSFDNLHDELISLTKIISNE